jgi:putative membrane protein
MEGALLVMWGYGWMGTGMMWASVLLGVVVIIAVIALLLPWLTRVRGPEPPLESGSALDILARRYARGEMDEATYERMRTRLQSMAIEERAKTPAAR